MIVTRQDIKDILLKWKNNVITAENVQNWAMNVCDSDFEYEDWDEHGNSVSNEILNMLDGLAMNLILQEDIDCYLRFLNTPIDKFKKGYSSWDKYLESINYDTRKSMLKNNMLYKQYCSNSATEK